MNIQDTFNQILTRFDELREERDAAIKRAEELDAKVKVLMAPHKSYDAMCAETERLRDALGSEQNNCADYADLVKVLQGQIEKLREDLSDEQQCVKDLLETCGELGRDIEKLRGELKRINIRYELRIDERDHALSQLATIAEKTAREQQKSDATNRHQHPDFWPLVTQMNSWRPLVTEAPSKPTENSHAESLQPPIQPEVVLGRRSGTSVSPSNSQDSSRPARGFACPCGAVLVSDKAPCPVCDRVGGEKTDPKANHQDDEGLRSASAPNAAHRGSECRCSKP